MLRYLGMASVDSVIPSHKSRIHFTQFDGSLQEGKVSSFAVGLHRSQAEKLEHE